VDKTRFNYLYVFLAMLGVLLLHDAIVRFQQVAPLPYSDFQRLLREGKVKEVVVTADRIQGELKEPEGGKKRFVTNRVEQDLVAEPVTTSSSPGTSRAPGSPRSFPGSSPSRSSPGSGSGCRAAWRAASGRTGLCPSGRARRRYSSRRTRR
jgi:hypothetical protein